MLVIGPQELVLTLLFAQTVVLVMRHVNMLDTTLAISNLVRKLVSVNVHVPKLAEIVAVPLKQKMKVVLVMRHARKLVNLVAS